ncbi:hypothetical protein [Neoaquamicrobium sediminum]|uniref:hypothetical protein n=1 Tax=Neoaquamicrobium sediminum TaxID=1849104 RepID=UPI00156469B3|nr:hypothetical protein [Mesorhizobium sediminum]NRC54187.1 hypothetical protein [Mesorhizobium sediminum]
MPLLLLAIENGTEEGKRIARVELQRMAKLADMVKRAPLDAQELATVLAALRFYQESGMGDPGNRSNAIHEIATNGDSVVSLDADAIDALCERLNVESSDGK